jgi:hypothetical protein
MLPQMKANKTDLVFVKKFNFKKNLQKIYFLLIFHCEDRGLLCAGQDLDVVGHPAYLLPTPRQYLSSEQKSYSITFKLPPILALIINSNHLP